MNNFSDGEAFGRVNLMGEHLDYNQGCVIPLQINKSVNVYLKKDTTIEGIKIKSENFDHCLLYTSPSPRDRTRSRMPSSA